MAKPTIVWHYTIGSKLEQIMASGEIRAATTFISQGERPAVWFSSNPAWEETANKLIITPEGKQEFGTKQTTHKLGGGLARIAVAIETAPHDWKAFQRLSGIDTKIARAMVGAAYEVGARISEWFVAFGPVTRDKWLSVEVWDGDAWQPHTPQSSNQPNQ